MGLVKNGGDKSTRFGTNRVAADKREMENLFFWWFMRTPGAFLRIFGEYGLLWEDFKELPSIRNQQRGFWGHFGLKTVSKVRFYLRFEVYGPKYYIYATMHVCLDCFGLFWTFLGERRKIFVSSSVARFAATKMAGPVINGRLHAISTERTAFMFSFITTAAPPPTCLRFEATLSSPFISSHERHLGRERRRRRESFHGAPRLQNYKEQRVECVRVRSYQILLEW